MKKSWFPFPFLSKLPNTKTKKRRRTGRNKYISYEKDEVEAGRMEKTRETKDTEEKRIRKPRRRIEENIKKKELLEERRKNSKQEEKGRKNQKTSNRKIKKEKIQKENADGKRRMESWLGRGATPQTPVEK